MKNSLQSNGATDAEAFHGEESPTGDEYGDEGALSWDMFEYMTDAYLSNGENLAAQAMTIKFDYALPDN